MYRQPPARPGTNLTFSASLQTQQKVYIETYGCQMNVADSEVVTSILDRESFVSTSDPSEADLILINTCAIRENAEIRVRGRLAELATHKKHRPGILIGVIGCMAERLKEQLLEEEKMVDLVVGPDAYRDLPTLVRSASSGIKGVQVLLSREETYADIAPVRINTNGVSAFVSIMRGCNNMCAYCIVPYTRGGERSRNPESILREVRELLDQGFREVTLLGQNVDSYHWKSGPGQSIGFASLIEQVALVSPQLRVRYSTSHPKDMSDEVLHVMAAYPNICRSIHLPAQSGSSRILDLMKRGYTREWYMGRIEAIRNIVPECSISTDLIAGFCTETDEDHQHTLSLMQEARFDFAFMFKYSERPGTLAARKYPDDVPDQIKARRLQEIIDLQNQISANCKQADIGKVFEVLAEGPSRKSEAYLSGRTSQNKVVVFPAEDYQKGDYVSVLIHSATSATLIGEAVKTH
jgi:tRNA-2-methylthio-N6-dimethylallyladenosine synthase